MSAYTSRNETLRSIGFASYADYLASDLWASIRARVLSKANRQCVRCGRDATEVHHKNYRIETLRGRVLDGMAAACSECHQYAEFTGGRKCSLKEANARLLGSSKPASVRVGKCSSPSIQKRRIRIRPDCCPVCANQLSKSGICRGCRKRSQLNATKEMKLTDWNLSAALRERQKAKSAESNTLQVQGAAATP